jgi:hypothetical protein
VIQALPASFASKQTRLLKMWTSGTSLVKLFLALDSFSNAGVSSSGRFAVGIATIEFGTTVLSEDTIPLVLCDLGGLERCSHRASCKLISST